MGLGWNCSLLCRRLKLPNPVLEKETLALILVTKSAFLLGLSEIDCVFELLVVILVGFILLYGSSNKYFLLKN